MYTKLLFLFSLAALLSCSSETKKEETTTGTDSTFKHHETSHHIQHHIDSTNNPFRNAVFTTEAFKNTPDSLGWGYNILINGKKTISQRHIPGASGVKGFKNKEYALKTADLIIYKIKHNILPPSVTLEELDSLGVLK